MPLGTPIRIMDIEFAIAFVFTLNLLAVVIAAVLFVGLLVRQVWLEGQNLWMAWKESGAE